MQQCKAACRACHQRLPQFSKPGSNRCKLGAGSLPRGAAHPASPRPAEVTTMNTDAQQRFLACRDTLQAAGLTPEHQTQTYPLTQLNNVPKKSGYAMEQQQLEIHGTCRKCSKES